MGDHAEIDELLRAIDEVVGTPEDPAICWSCEERPGLPSLCEQCRQRLLRGGGDNMSPP